MSICICLLIGLFWFVPIRFWRRCVCHIWYQPLATTAATAMKYGSRSMKFAVTEPELAGETVRSMPRK